MVNTRTVLVVMGTVTVYNMIIARTFFQNSLPEELFEAAELDGCGAVSYTHLDVYKRQAGGCHGRLYLGGYRKYHAQPL